MTELSDMYQLEPLDHYGHATCLSFKYSSQYRYTNQRGWLVYKDGYWQTDGAEASVRRGIATMLREREEQVKNNDNIKKRYKAAMRTKCKVNSGVVNGILIIFKTLSEVEDNIELFDKHTNLLNVANGSIDLKTGELLSHSPEHRFTYKLSTSYRPEKLDDNLADKAWFIFLDSLKMDKVVTKFMQRMFGYMLTGSTKDELMFYFWGPTRCGKGTITSVLLSIMESLSFGTNFRIFTSKRHGDVQNFDLAPLKGKRLVSASESNRDEQVNGAVFKQATGGDPIFAAFKGKDGFTFLPQWKILLSSNFTLNADPFDNAIWARVRTVRFTESFVGKEDKQLKSKLQTDESKEIILAWMVDGAMQWYTDGLPLPKQISDATTYQRLQASSVLLFVDECCKINTGAKVDGQAFYKSYVAWCHSDGYRPFGRKRFTQGLDDIGITTSVSRVEGAVKRQYTNVDYLGDGLGTGDITKKLFT